MSWVSLINLILSILNWMLRIGEENKWISIGEQKQLARDQAEILRKSEYGKKMLADVERLSDDELDRELRDLER